MAFEKIGHGRSMNDAASEHNGVTMRGAFATWPSLREAARSVAAEFEEYGSFLIDSTAGLPAISMLIASFSVPGARTVWGIPAQLGEAVPSSLDGVYRIPAITNKDYPRDRLYGTMTSGSTGTPKIPMGRVEDLLAAAQSHEDNIFSPILGKSSSSGTLATCLRSDYVAPFLMCLLPAMQSGRSLLFTDQFRFEPVFERLATEPVIFLCVPALLSALTAFAAARGSIASDGLTIICTGGHLSKARVDAAKGVLPGVAITTTYGSSEYGTMTFNPAAKGDFHVGPAVRGREIWISNPDAQGRGKILTRGVECRCFYAYTNVPIIDAHGDALGNDYGHIDTAGNVHVDGRIDGAIKINGILVYAGLIEKHVLALPGVVDARVKSIFGVDGESDCLSLTVVGTVGEQEVLAHCKQLPAGYVPRMCAVLPDTTESYSSRGKL